MVEHNAEIRVRGPLRLFSLYYLSGSHNCKGLAKLGNMVADSNVSSLAAQETCVAQTNFAARKQKCFCHGVRNIFASRTQILRLKHMFPSLATPGNITRNIVSPTVFPSLAKP